MRYRAAEAPSVTVHCACSDCRKLGGTGHSTHSVVPAKGFEISGAVTAWEKVADSGNRINRRFCPVCGAQVYHTRDGMEGLVVLRTSSLDDPEVAVPARVIYMTSAVTWDHFDPGLPKFEKMSVPKG
ncbi:aldehyde-activating protein [Algicella marina]|uniref:Aldehyde-activating protein n=1 Tax=Algicella marina TaxID=2683284 RepID=A0A6P1T6Z6_9RHOB|nr:aldehyde-activating protein [Algicella marina]